jgi:hypothetical protein
VCRRSYVHPAVIASYLDGGLHIRPMAGDEAAVLSLLRRRARARAA